MSDFFKSVQRRVVKLFDKHREVRPAFFLDSPRGILLVPVSWENAEQKRLACVAVGHLCKAVQAQRVAVVCEAWMTKQAIDFKAPADFAPSLQPNREEVLWFVGQTTVDGEQDLVGTYPIVRPQPGSPYLGAFLEHESVAIIFDNMLGGKILQ